MIMYFDTNVLLDVLLFRTPHVEHSARALSFCANGKARGMFSSLSACDMVYILGRCGFSKSESKERVLTLAKAIGMQDLEAMFVIDALQSSSSDFEDAVQMLCAMSNHANMIVTRDKTGFANATIPVLTPTEFLNMEIDDTEATI